MVHTRIHKGLLHQCLIESLREYIQNKIKIKFLKVEENVEDDIWSHDLDFL